MISIGCRWPLAALVVIATAGCAAHGTVENAPAPTSTGQVVTVPSTPDHLRFKFGNAVVKVDVVPERKVPIDETSSRNYHIKLEYEVLAIDGKKVTVKVTCPDGTSSEVTLELDGKPQPTGCSTIPPPAPPLPITIQLKSGSK